MQLTKWIEVYDLVPCVSCPCPCPVFRMTQVKILCGLSLLTSSGLLPNDMATSGTLDALLSLQSLARRQGRHFQLICESSPCYLLPTVRSGQAASTSVLSLRNSRVRNWTYQRQMKAGFLGTVNRAHNENAP